MNSTRNRVTPALALAAALLTIIASCSSRKSEDAAPATRTVNVAPVATAPLGDALRAVGLLAPKDEARLSFKVGGVIDSIAVEEGAAVKQGQVLAILKQAEIGAMLEQARQAAAKAERDLGRAKALFADGVATEEQVQDLTTALTVAKAVLHSAEFNSRYARIEAPANGVVLRKLAEANELVQAGQPVLVVSGLERGWIVKTSLADRDIVHVSLGDTVGVAFDAYPGRSFTGRVTNVSSAADAATGTFPIEVQVDAGGTRFVQGLVAKITLAPKGAQTTAATVVPLQALLEANGGEAYVFVFDAAAKTVKRVSIRIGRIAEEQIEVLAGLHPGQQVVIDGAAFLADGEKVRLADPRLADALREPATRTE
jgi:RND family efflux transporter MFP subunit